MANKVKHKGALRKIESREYVKRSFGRTCVMWLECGHRAQRGAWKMNNRANGRRGIPIKRVHCLKCLNAV